MSTDSFTQTTTYGNNINAAENAHVSIGNLVITNLSSKDLITFTRQFLCALNRRDWNTGRIHLASLQSLGSLDTECKLLLEVLDYKLNISIGNDCNIAPNIFLELLRSPNSCDLIKDFVESVFIQYLSCQSEADARERYISSPYKGSYSTAFFYEKLANIDELVEFTGNGLIDLFEFELCALVRCSLRCQNFILSLELATELNKKYNNNNSKIILSNVKAWQLCNELDGRHHFFISSSQMLNLENQIEDCIKLANETNDFRTIQTASILLSLTYFSNPELISICQKNITEAENTVPHIRQYLSASSEERTSNSANEILINSASIIDENQFHSIYHAWINGDVQHNEIKSWLDNKGDVSSNNHQVKSFIEVALKILACDPEDDQSQQSLSETLENYCKDNADFHKVINPLVIYQICLALKKLRLPIFIVKLLDSLIPQIPWCSPALDIYAEALLDSEQSERLVQLINRMNSIEESYRFLAIKIQLSIDAGDFAEAIHLIEIAISRYDNSCYYWALLLHTYFLANTAQSDIALSISKIPKNILAKYSYEGMRLLNFIARTDLSLAENYILEWFINNPVAMAVHVTNLHFNNLDRNNILPSTYPPSGRCSQAVTYMAGKRHYTKLLVDNCSPSEYLLDTHSPLGMLLAKASINDSFNVGMETYTVIEKMPPFVGAFRISMNIRSDINPGTDCFYQFTIEDNGVEDILRHIEFISQQKQLLVPEIDGQTIPLLMRLNHTHKNDLVRGAFLYLMEKSSNQNMSLFANGETINESVVLDILSLSYLSLTGFCHGLLRNKIKLYVTRETFEIVSDWLSKTGSPDFLSIGKTEHGFIKTTAQDIAKDDSFNNLKLLLSKCSIISPKNFDMPEMMPRIRDVLDISHYSSLKASISNSIPFLCFDSMFCHLYQQLNIELANTFQLVSDAHSKNHHEEDKHVECHVQYGLPVPISPKELITLCRKEGRGQYLASELLKMHPNNYPTSYIALCILVECCLKSICSAKLTHTKSLSLSKWRYTEHIVYACCETAMVNLDGASSEARLAVLIAHVMYIAAPMKFASQLAITLFNKFAHGHFLDIEKINIEIDVLMNDIAQH